MSLKKIVNAIGLGQSRADRMKRIRAKSTKLVFSDLNFELEKRQLLATFSYSSGLLTIQTDSTNEQLSIISTSENGNYTITTLGTWSGSPVSGLSNTSTDLYVNQPSGLASILVNDNGGTVSNSSFSFGASSANFVSNLAVNFTNSTSGVITVANAASFINGMNLNLTTTGNQITVSNRTSVNSTGAISLTGRNISVGATITSAAGNISLIGNGSGSYQAGSFQGVLIGSSVSSTEGGNIVIDGRGGSSGGEGVFVQQPVLTSNGAISITGDANVGKGIAVQGSSATIIANGTNGSVTLTAFSGISGETRGMDFWNNAKVSTSDGPIILTGTSRSNSSDNGVWVEGNANVTAGNSGAVTVFGYGVEFCVVIDG